MWDITVTVCPGENLQTTLITNGTMASGDELMEAIEGGDEAGVKRCLDDGADALHAEDEGFTALHMAAQEGFDAIATMLLRKGAKMDATDDDGVTPLMLACAGGHDAVVNMLLKERCDVMRVDKAGRSALFRVRRGERRVLPRAARRLGGRVRVPGGGQDDGGGCGEEERRVQAHARR